MAYLIAGCQAHVVKMWQDTDEEKHIGTIYEQRADTARKVMCDLVQQKNCNPMPAECNG